MKKFILILFASAVCFNLIAQESHISKEEELENYLDSIFNARLEKEQIKDSTLLNKIYYHIYEAEIAFQKGDNQNAIEHLDICLNYNFQEKYPKEFSAATYLFYKINYLQKHYEEAYRFLQLAYLYSPKNTNYLQELAWFEFNIQNFDTAIKLLERLNKLQPNNSNNIYGLCQAYLRGEKYNKALKELDKYQHLEGHSIDLLKLKTDIYNQAKAPQKAIKAVHQYIKDYPEDLFSASFLLADIYRNNNDSAEALHIFNELDKKYPNNGAILLSIADLHKNAGNDSLYEEYTFRAIDTKGLKSAAAVKVIRPILADDIQKNNLKRVEETCNYLNEIYPDQAAISRLRADIYKALNDTIKWTNELYTLRELEFDENVDFELLSLVEQQQNKEEILKIALEGYNKFKNDTWAFYRIISLSYINNQDSMVNVSLDLLPTISTPNIKSKVYQIIGDIYSSQGNQLAMAMYDSCLVYDPRNSGALNNVAYNITKQTNPDLKRAEKLAATALEIEPESIYVLDTYAWILFLRGDNFLSEFYFNKLLRIEEEKGEQPTIETLYHIGCLYMKTNRINEATEMWKKALKQYSLNPNTFDDINIIKSIMDFLKQNYEN